MIQIGQRTTTTRWQIFQMLVLYRWGSLVPPLFAILTRPAQVNTLEVSLPLLFFAALIYTLVLTAFQKQLNQWLLRYPFLMGLDMIFVAMLLSLTDAPLSPFYLYALSPILAGGFFFPTKSWLGALVFTPLYIISLVIGKPLSYTFANLDVVVTQFVGLWVFPALFSYAASLLDEITRSNEEANQNSKALKEQHGELSQAYQQLQIVHDLNMMLQAAPDVQSVMNRVLTAVTEDLGYAQAAIGLAEPDTFVLAHWRMRAGETFTDLHTPDYNGAHEDSIISQVLQTHATRQQLPPQSLTLHKKLNQWLHVDTSWLIVPLILRDHPVGILLVRTETAELPGAQMRVLELVASQVAVALGTTMLCIDRARQLAIEQERNRIARDIHDTIAQSLFGIVFTLDALEQMLPQNPEQVKAELADLRQLASHARNQVRQSIFNIWPSKLTFQRFEEDLRAFVNDCSSTPLKIEFTLDGDFNLLDPASRRNLYRIAQEALNNVSHHAQTDQASLLLEVATGETAMTIRDAGRGFVPDIALSRTHNRDTFGLRGIVERTQSLGGTCKIDSAPNAGTCIRVCIPTRLEVVHA